MDFEFQNLNLFCHLDFVICHLSFVICHYLVKSPNKKSDPVTTIRSSSFASVLARSKAPPGDSSVKTSL